MYDEHFGLTGRPFQLTPDPAFWYESATHRRAMAYLGYGLAQGEGFIVITGDAGAGKTTLVGHLLTTLDRDAINPIRIVSTAVPASELLRLVADQLGVGQPGLERAELLTAIDRSLHAVARTGRRTLLIVEDGQALAIDAVEDLRMLSTLQAGGHALLQIVLLGGPELRAALQGSTRLEHLRQRVIAIHHLDPMGEDEIAPYLRHRLKVVGWSGRPHFADSAFAAFYRLTDGVPRRLNQLANRVMLHAAIEGADTVTDATVGIVAGDLLADMAMPGEVAGIGQPVAPVDVDKPSGATLPFRHSWMAVEIEPVDPPVTVAPVGSEPAPLGADAPLDDDTAARLVEIEARIEHQDTILRRVLALMVDWVEGERGSRQAPPDADDPPRGYAPIRGAAA